MPPSARGPPASPRLSSEGAASFLSHPSIPTQRQEATGTRLQGTRPLHPFPTCDFTPGSPGGRTGEDGAGPTWLPDRWTRLGPVIRKPCQELARKAIFWSFIRLINGFSCRRQLPAPFSCCALGASRLISLIVKGNYQLDHGRQAHLSTPSRRGGDHITHGAVRPLPLGHLRPHPGLFTF